MPTPEVGVGREGGAQRGHLGPHRRTSASSDRARSVRPIRPAMVCISPVPMPAVVSAAVPRRRPEVTKGERGSSGMVLRLR
jgi:hypothetical protein